MNLRKFQVITYNSDKFLKRVEEMAGEILNKEITTSQSINYNGLK